MRKHPLVKDMRKLNFHLVPMSGVAKSNGGDKKFRAEFVRGHEEGDNRGVLGVDRVLAEAIEAHHLNGVSPDMLKLYVEAVLQTMIDKTVEDGRTRRFDDYLSVSLKIHGGFEERSDDYDFDRHSLALTVQALNAFRPNLSSIYPVNVNRKKLFRLSYVTAADGKHGNHEIVYGQDFIIRGTGLDMPKQWYIVCHVRREKNVQETLDVDVKKRTENEILCNWPEGLGEDQMRRSVEFAVVKLNDDFDTDEKAEDKYRYLRASILPE